MFGVISAWITVLIRNELNNSQNSFRFRKRKNFKVIANRSVTQGRWKEWRCPFRITDFKKAKFCILSFWVIQRELRNKFFFSFTKKFGPAIILGAFCLPFAQQVPAFLSFIWNFINKSLCTCVMFLSWRMIIFIFSDWSVPVLFSSFCVRFGFWLFSSSFASSFHRIFMQKS